MLGVCSRKCLRNAPCGNVVVLGFPDEGLCELARLAGSGAATPNSETLPKIREIMSRSHLERG